MKVNDIEKMIIRYYDGETTEAEEKELKQFFTSDDVPDHLQTDKELFLQMASHQENEVPNGLEDRLSNLIDEWDTHDKQIARKQKHTRILRLQWVGSIAASLLILFSVGIYIHKNNIPLSPKDTCTTPEEAYNEAQKALLMFSATINKSVKQVETVQVTTEKIQEKVNQQLYRINTLEQ